MKIGLLAYFDMFSPLYICCFYENKPKQTSFEEFKNHCLGRTAFMYRRRAAQSMGFHGVGYYL